MVFPGNSSVNFLPSVHAFYNHSLDIAGCVLVPQADEALNCTASIPLDIHVPSVGDVVYMASLDNLSAEDLSQPSDVKEGKFHFKMSQRVSVRCGVVTGVYPQGLRQYRWPCFTTSIPAEAGMSGGFVFVPQVGRTVAACGVVCADLSPSEAFSNFHVCGESLIGCAWPALGLRLNETIPAPADAPLISMLDLMRKGSLPPAVGDLNRIKIEDIGDGNFRIHLSRR